MTRRRAIVYVNSSVLLTLLKGMRYSYTADLPKDAEVINVFADPNHERVGVVLTSAQFDEVPEMGELPVISVLLTS